MSRSKLLYWACSTIPADLSKRRARLWRLHFALADSHQHAPSAFGGSAGNRLDDELSPPWFVMFLAREPSQVEVDTLELELD